MQTNSTQYDTLIRRMPFFYGWVIMALGALGLIMTSPGQTFAVSIFLEYLIADLSVNRSVVSTLYTVGTLLGSFALPFVGRRIDQYGSRKVMTTIVLIFGIACIYMGFVQNALMLLFGFTAIRMFGQGSLSLVSTNIINQWWVRRRGMVLGISGVLMALFGTGAFPSVLNVVIPAFGWRLTYMVLGLVLLLGMAPLVWLLARDRPEDHGLQPDGVVLVSSPVSASPNAQPVPSVAVLEENWTMAEASKTPVLWVFSAGLASVAMLTTGLSFHIVSIFNDNGLSATAAATVYVPVALVTALVNLGSGILVDRIPVRYLLALGLFLQATSLLMAQNLSGVVLAFIFGVILGMTNGLVRTVGTVVWAMYFGRKHLGSITGVTNTIFIAGSALGPMPFGIAHDLLGSYNLVLTISAFIPFSLGILSLFFDKPSKTI